MSTLATKITPTTPTTTSTIASTASPTRPHVAMQTSADELRSPIERTRHGERTGFERATNDGGWGAGGVARGRKDPRSAARRAGGAGGVGGGSASMQAVRHEQEEVCRDLIRLAVQNAIKMAMIADPTLSRDGIADLLSISRHTVNGWCAGGRESVPEAPTLVRMVLDDRVLPAIAREQLCRTLMTGCGLVVSVPAKADAAPIGDQVNQITAAVGVVAALVVAARADLKVDAREREGLVKAVRMVELELEQLREAMKGEGTRD